MNVVVRDSIYIGILTWPFYRDRVNAKLYPLLLDVPSSHSDIVGGNEWPDMFAWLSFSFSFHYSK